MVLGANPAKEKNNPQPWSRVKEAKQRPKPIQKSPTSSTYYEPRGSKYPIIRYLGFWVIVIIVQVRGKYMIVRYFDPSGKSPKSSIKYEGSGNHKYCKRFQP